jgi:branched-chain amino acid transport system ATP-binding protein
VLKVQGLAAGYGDVQVLWGVDLEVGPASRVALLGANGAGKTTLLKTLSGVLPAWGGRILWDGRDVSRASPMERVRLGMTHVPEGRKLFAGMTVRENLLMGAYLRSDGRGVRRDLDWVLGVFPELAERQNQLAGTLSGGQQQMCAIGRGLMAAPRLLMVDEMSLGLAPVIVDRIIETLGRAAAERGVALLMVEQDVPLACEFSERGYVLETGHVTLHGPAPDLLASDLVRKAYLGL